MDGSGVMPASWVSEFYGKVKEVMGVIDFSGSIGTRFLWESKGRHRFQRLLGGK